VLVGQVVVKRVLDSDVVTCTRCSAKVPDDSTCRTLCLDCQECKASDARDRYVRRKVAGQCVRCGSDSDGDSMFCDKHKKRTSWKERALLAEAELERVRSRCVALGWFFS